MAQLVGLNLRSHNHISNQVEESESNLSLVAGKIPPKVALDKCNLIAWSDTVRIESGNDPDRFRYSSKSGWEIG